MAEFYLTGVVAALSAGAETRQWHDENLFSHSVDLSNAFAFADDRNIGLSDPQWNVPSYRKERQPVNDDSLTFKPPK